MPHRGAPQAGTVPHQTAARSAQSWRRTLHGWVVSEFLGVLGANARNDGTITKLLSPAKPAKSPLGRSKTAKFSPARLRSLYIYLGTVKAVDSVLRITSHQTVRADTWRPTYPSLWQALSARAWPVDAGGRTWFGSGREHGKFSHGVAWRGVGERAQRAQN